MGAEIKKVNGQTAFLNIRLLYFTEQEFESRRTGPDIVAKS
jgi:hypothetical protein